MAQLVEPGEKPVCKISGGGIRGPVGAAKGPIRTHYLYGVTLDELARSLSMMPDSVDRPVVNRTGIAGTFDIHLEYTHATKTAWLAVRSAPRFSQPWRNSLA